MNLATTKKIETESYDLTELKKLIQEKMGIYYSQSKDELIKTRLRSHILKLNLKGIKEYESFLRGLPTGHEEWQNFTNLMTTNKTNFFREKQHFDHLIESVLPEKSSQQNLKVWCAAASSGEEPYTLSMVLKNHWKNPYSILGTDIDTHVLRRAENAVYPEHCLNEIPMEYHNSLIKGTGEVSDWVKINAATKAQVKFQRFNLIDSVKFESEFDIIFCRNVLIYFTPETIQKVIAQLYQAARPGAYLYIGRSESLQNIKHQWDYVGPSVYKKAE